MKTIDDLLELGPRDIIKHPVISNFLDLNNPGLFKNWYFMDMFLRDVHLVDTDSLIEDIMSRTDIEDQTKVNNIVMILKEKALEMYEKVGLILKPDISLDNIRKFIFLEYYLIGLRDQDFLEDLDSQMTEPYYSFLNVLTKFNYIETSDYTDTIEDVKDYYLEDLILNLKDEIDYDKNLEFLQTLVRFYKTEVGLPLVNDLQFIPETISFNENIQYYIKRFGNFLTKPLDKRTMAGSLIFLLVLSKDGRDNLLETYDSIKEYITNYDKDIDNFIFAYKPVVSLFSKNVLNRVLEGDDDDD